MSGVFDQSLAAFDRFLAGDVRQAGQALAALEWRQADEYYPTTSVASSCPSAGSRLPSGCWRAATRPTPRAFYLGRSGRRTRGVGKALLKGLAELQRARIEDARGHPALAEAQYRQFLTRYDMPMPTNRHLVEEANAALARLSGRADPARDRAR